MIWGGLKNLLEPYYGNIILKILLNAGKSPNLEIVYAFSFFLLSALKFSPEFKRINRVKITRTRGQSAGVISIHTSKASQRLHAGDPKYKLDPTYISGFSYASFHISILKHSSYKLGFQFLPVFTIQLHYKDLALLELIKLYFNVGKVIIKKDNTKTNVIYTVQSIKDLANVIIPHFDKYPLLTQKQADFILFKQIISLMVQGKYLTAEGLIKNLALKASINKGFNEKFKQEQEQEQEFPNLIASPRPEVLSSLIPFNLQWLLGFIEAEGSFFCLVRKNPSHKIGYQVTLTFTLAQHSRNLALMTKNKDILGLGLINQTSSMVLYTITRKSDINTLVPMVEGGLKGAKALAFRDF